MKFCGAIFLFVQFLLTGANLWAQEVIVTEEGRRIAVYSDGSWEYFENDTTGSSGKYNEMLNLQEVKEAKTALHQVTLKLIQTRIEKVKLEELIASAHDNQEGGRQTKASFLKEKLKTTEKTEKEHAVLSTRLQAKVDLLERLIYTPDDVRRALIEAHEHRDKLLNYTEFQPIVPSYGKTDVSKSDISNLGSSRVSRPETPCQIIYEGKDQSTGLMRRDIEPALLFSYTDLSLEPFFDQHDLILCNGHLTWLEGGRYFLNLEFHIANENAARIFGGFRRGDFIEIIMIGGTRVRLINAITNNGKASPKTNFYVFNCQYAIGSKEEKILRNGEIDTILIRWKNVKEKYEIHELDFFKNQFRCIDN
jgi:hypothetical protein